MLTKTIIRFFHFALSDEQDFYLHTGCTYADAAASLLGFSARTQPSWFSTSKCDICCCHWYSGALFLFLIIFGCGSFVLDY